MSTKPTATSTTAKVCNNNEQEIESTNHVEVAGNSVTLTPRTGIQTLAFFDLEASGLRSSTSKSRITELSLVAVSVPDLVSSQSRLVVLSVIINQTIQPKSFIIFGDSFLVKLM